MFVTSVNVCNRGKHLDYFQESSDIQSGTHFMGVKVDHGHDFHPLVVEVISINATIGGGVTN